MLHSAYRSKDIVLPSLVLYICKPHNMKKWVFWFFSLGHSNLSSFLSICLQFLKSQNFSRYMLRVLKSNTSTKNPQVLSLSRENTQRMRRKLAISCSRENNISMKFFFPLLFFSSYMCTAKDFKSWPTLSYYGQHIKHA